MNIFQLFVISCNCFLSISDYLIDPFALQDPGPLHVIVSVITDMDAMSPGGQITACKWKKKTTYIIMKCLYRTRKETLEGQI